MSFKTFCKGCQEENYECNLFEGLCHRCWRDANPEHSCDLCIYARFSLGEDGECIIRCDKGVKWPLDALEPEDAKNKICEFRKEKENAR